MKFLRLCLVVLAFGFLLPASARQYYVYFGTYTGEKSKGIYISEFDDATGKLSQPQLAAETKSPSFLALHPNRKLLFAVGEASSIGTNRHGAVSAYSVEARTGKLTLINSQPSGGGGPCHLAVDAKRRLLLTANYGSGSVAALPFADDGRLAEPLSVMQHTGSSVNKNRQAGPHAHCVNIDPDNRFVVACDLGTDKVMVYRLDAEHGLAENDPPFATVAPGAGPRHVAFAPNGKFLYVVNEMASTVTTFTWNAKKGELAEVQTVSTLPTGFTGNTSCAEIEAHPSGKFVYASNRGHDSIAVFGVDKASGKLTAVEHESTQGRTPRHFALDPSGKWLLAQNQNSASVVLFSVDKKTGALEPTGEKVEITSAVCAVFLPKTR